MTKKEIQEQINKLQKELDKCPEIEPFEAKGEWSILYDGTCTDSSEEMYMVKEHFNYWATEKQAKQASEYQRKFNMIINYIMQFDGELGKHNYFVYYSTPHKSWQYTYTNTNGKTPGVYTMSRDCASALAEDMNSGRVKL